MKMVFIFAARLLLNYGDEEDVSAIKQKEKEQARLQGAHGFCQRPSGDF
jgi:hypothetical protein